MAHIAFTHDPLVVIIDGHFIGACKQAVLAADTLIVQMDYDSSFWILFISVYGATGRAGRFEAMVTGSGYVLQNR
jgi:hypothetical protein